MQKLPRKITGNGWCKQGTYDTSSPPLEAAMECSMRQAIEASTETLQEPSKAIRWLDELDGAYSQTVSLLSTQWMPSATVATLAPRAAWQEEAVANLLENGAAEADASILPPERSVLMLWAASGMQSFSPKALHVASGMVVEEDGMLRNWRLGCPASSSISPEKIESRLLNECNTAYMPKSGEQLLMRGI